MTSRDTARDVSRINHHQLPTSQSIDLMLLIVSHDIPDIATARP
jgi:hypothetical protein